MEEKNPLKRIYMVVRPRKRNPHFGNSRNLDFKKTIIFLIISTSSVIINHH